MTPSFHLLLLSNQTAFQREVFAQLSGSDLTTGQPKVLDYLDDHDGASQKELAKGCCIEPASLSALLRGMEDKGLITRKNLHGDRRTSYIFLTDLGRSCCAKVAAAFQRAETLVFQGFSDAEREPFLALFARMGDNLQAERGRGEHE